MIVGHRGQLGTDLAAQFAQEELILTTQEQLDVRQERQVLDYVSGAQPDLILNCSAFHRVDDCEEQAETALSVNALGAMYLARAARATQSVLVHYSTDYVFDGPGPIPHPESKAPNPKSIYAASKLSGEGLVLATWPRSFVIRTCGLYGYRGSREKGTNFVETMIQLGRGERPLKVVDDQVCTPTATRDLAAATCALVSTDAFGLYHLTNTGECSWFSFATEIFRLMGLQPQVTAVASSEFPQKAKRPDYSVLDNWKYRQLGFPDMLPWQEALETYIRGRVSNGRD
jgi:dTDP-4-dehydrorhamnose reductase